MVDIPDTAFLNALVESGVDHDGDGKISMSEAEAVTSLDISGDGVICGTEPLDPCWNEGNINNLSGIASFINLDTLICKYNRIDSVFIPSGISLKYLDCSYQRIDYLVISNNTVLEYLDCTKTYNKDLDISNYPALTHFFCERNYLNTLNCSNITSLKHLDCGFNKLRTLDISQNIHLTELLCNNNELSDLNLTKNTSLEWLNCRNNELHKLDLTQNPDLRILNCRWDHLSELDLTFNTILEEAYCSGNPLFELDLRNNTSLKKLELSYMSTLGEVLVPCNFSEDSVEIYLGDEGSWSWSENVYFTKDCSTSSYKNPEDKISIYPNPTPSILTIATNETRQYLIQFYNVSGQLIFKLAMEKPIHHIDLSSYKSDMYFITISNRDSYRAEKIIKL
jgi:hypothetical protein